MWKRGKMNRGSEEYRESVYTMKGSKPKSLSLHDFFYMAAFHRKLADFLFLLWIMNFIQTVFCHKQERLKVQPVVKIHQQIKLKNVTFFFFCLVYTN